MVFDKEAWRAAVTPANHDIFSQVESLCISIMLDWPKDNDPAAQDKLTALTETAEFRELGELIPLLPEEVRPPTAEPWGIMSWVVLVASARGEEAIGG